MVQRRSSLMNKGVIKNIATQQGLLSIKKKKDRIELSALGRQFRSPAVARCRGRNEASLCVLHHQMMITCY